MHTQSHATGVLSSVLTRFLLIAMLGGGAIGFAADPPTVQIVVPNTTPPAIQAGAAPRPFQITVANDVAGDTPRVTSFTLNGVACTAATCGSFGAVTGTAGSGNYSMIYTPPATLDAGVSPTVTVSPSVSGPTFPGTVSFLVFQAGVAVQTTSIAGGLNIVQPGSPLRTITFTTYNDIGNAGVAVTLTGAGYACQNLQQNSCGILGAPEVSKSGTTTTTVVTYASPKSIPDPPYDRVRIQASSIADPTRLASINFLLTPIPTPPAFIGYGQKFGSSLTGAAPVTVTFPFGDATAAKSATWTLTANGATCPASVCGTLGTPTVTTNGNSVNSTVTYTPPASVPAGSGQDFPTITATSTGNATLRDRFSFHILDGTCGTGANSLLNGSYAFLLKGASATGGYETRAGSFTADGNGNVTAGVVDINRSSSVLINSTLKGSYSVGPDNRGCLSLTNSTGGTAAFRIAVGTVSGGTATQGALTAFGDTTGQGSRLTGVLKQQDLTNVTSSAFSGTYAFGEDGMDSSGNRIAAAGLITADGAGNLTDVTVDVNDGGGVANLAGGSGSYSLASNAPGGRAAVQITIPTPGGPATSKDAFYMISPSDFFFISTEPTDLNHPIVSGELKLQTGPFSTGVLTGGYVLYLTGIDDSNGAGLAILAQSQFTNKSGTATLTLDYTDNGISTPQQPSLQLTFTVDSSGRVSAVGSGDHPPVIYLVDSTQGFVVATDSTVASGYLQQQTLSSFDTSTLSGQFFFGGGAATIGGPFESGTIHFAPDTPSGTLAGTSDGSRPNFLLGCDQDCGGGGGLQPNSSFSGFPYTFSTAPAAPGQGCLGDVAAGQACLGNLLGYIISPSKVILLQTGTPGNESPAEIVIAQQ